ncbi:hypothetical protein PIB30_056862 [Stylosanthes scabra]|uniref:Integrase catalytic domain-containing protein n=1 Tax=Stylosanthes scabra TaxID=79078 RepID=A0ABU6SJR4_9FABA|nr:hypothetical protein [Stylosanthes scabra]
MWRNAKDSKSTRSYKRFQTTELSAIVAPWSFDKWGIDLLGPFQKSTRPKSLCGTTSPGSESQRIITSNNGTQFTGKRFREFLEGIQIHQQFSSVEHPQPNDQNYGGICYRINTLPTHLQNRSNDPIRNCRKNRSGINLWPGRADIGRNNSDQEKLGGNSEEPYQVDEALRKESYKPSTTKRMAEMELISKIREKIRGKGIRVPGIRHDEYIS